MVFSIDNKFALGYMLLVDLAFRSVMIALWNCTVRAHCVCRARFNEYQLKMAQAIFFVCSLKIIIVIIFYR